MDEVIHYTLSGEHPHRHFISFEVQFPVSSNRTRVQLPAWRPGRYELGDFAKNIRAWKATSPEGKELAYQKISKDLWEIETEGLESFHLSYQFYADTVNAGSTYLDAEQLYVNPVNCFFYLPDHQELPVNVSLRVPENYRLASPLNNDNRSHEFRAKNVQELMDSPFIASARLEHWTFEMDNVLFHIWIQGDHAIDKDRMLSEFRAYTRAQIDAFGEFPVKEYLYLFQFLPYKAYHGVEHEQCTVIALGPSSEIAHNLYKELLGVSCHELYHTWNIKAIRPEEMFPYDFSKENYSRLGYVAEGVTTYFGDQFLHRSDVFSDQLYYEQLSLLLQRHMDNPGRKNLSVAESSFDTWLDGYVPGIPWRKVSIYNEGALCALICDLKILKATNGQKSLDDVMKRLYLDYAKEGKSYSEKDYQILLEEISGESFQEIIDELISGTSDYLPYLSSSLDGIGLEIIDEEARSFIESHWGCKVDDKLKVIAVLPESAADKAGIWLGDVLISINEHVFNGDKDRHAAFYSRESNEILINRRNVLHRMSLKVDSQRGYRRWIVRSSESPTADQKIRFKAWKRSKN